MELFKLPLVESLKDSPYPSPEEYTYWNDRNSRTFYVDYEVDEDYMLIELGKIIIQMNIAEKDIPKEELKPIRLFIHSYGGDIEQANFLCDLIKSSRIPVYTIAMGVAMSAGFLLLISGHKRYAFPHTQTLVHTGSARFQGTAEQIDEAQKNYKRQINGMKDYILEQTEIDEKTFNKNKTKDWYLSSEELISFKVVDEIISDITTIL